MVTKRSLSLIAYSLALPSTQATLGISGGTQRFILFAASFSIALGGLALLGWHDGIEVLKRGQPDMVAMNPVTACCLIVCGIGIALHRHSMRKTAAVAGALVSLVALAKLIDLTIGGLAIDQVLFSSLLHGPLDLTPNRMAANTALALLLLGLSLISSGSCTRQVQVFGQSLGVAIALISMLTLSGYALGLQQLTAIGPTIPMAPITGLCLFFSGIAVITLRRDTLLLLLLRDRGPAGLLARRVLPLAIVIPLAVGAAEVWGEQRGYFEANTGIKIMVLANMLITSTLLIVSFVELYRSDRLRKDREQALRQSESLNQTINDASPDCVSLLDQDGNVLFSNQAAIVAYGLESDAQLIGRPWGHLLDVDAQADRDVALDAARTGGVGRLRLSISTCTGGLRWFESLVSRVSNADEQLVRFMVMSRDITQQKSAEDQVRWTATHDSLTGLPNRALFQEQVDQLGAQANSRFALLLLDIDDFKIVNDTLGHDAGDALLSTIGKRLRKSVREDDFVARLGGDEFAIILHEVKSKEATVAAAAKILDLLKEPWLYNGRLADCRVSIGASISALHGGDPAELLKKADMALYAAKTQGRERFALFQTVMRAQMEKRASELSLGRSAIAQDLIVPHYQPKIELRSGKLIGFEALLRWRHPTRGIQKPTTIAAAFEDVDLARALTDRILCSVITDMRHWSDIGLHFGHVAVNVAAADFKQSDFAERLIEKLDSGGVPRSRLQVEVTETVFLGRGAEYVEHALKTLSVSGIRIALDDFGTGYASLSHLKQFPVDIVKLDQSFLRDVEDAHNQAIIRTVIGLGRSLNLDVVAEGVETEEQEAYLIAQGCPFGQGYLYGKAVPARRVREIIQSFSESLHEAA